MSLKNRAKNALRVRAGRLAVRVPPERGPQVWRHTVGRARVFEARRLRAVGDLDAAESTVQPLL
ncbi:MAG: hypothetical protein ACRDO1_19840, partial [Nocardioidaceae bacterium]